MVLYNTPGWRPVLSLMRRWSTQFEKYDRDVALAASIVNTPLLDEDDDEDDDDDDGDCESVQPSCRAAEDSESDDIDDEDDEVFETGWPARTKTRWFSVMHH